MKNEDYTIIIDTREQQPWEFSHYTTASKKLDTGDYSIEGLQDIIAIERKKSVSEIATNIVEPRFKDVLERLKTVKYPFILLEFSLKDVLIYPIGSNVPRHMWDKIKISSTFILKNITDWELEHNIKVFFCGSASNAEKLATYLFNKIYFKEVKSKRKDDSNET
jgi:ERCC4-type nuclease